MSEFPGFSEAAQLYAENLSIVTAMKEVFDQEIEQYLNHLADAVREQLETSDFQDQTKATYRYWWIGTDGEASDKYTRIWFPARPSDVLTENQLRLHVQVPSQSPERVAKAKQLPAREEFKFVMSSRTAYANVDAVIQCDEADFIETPARQIAALLTELGHIDGMC
jgi:hypothetical protein